MLLSVKGLQKSYSVPVLTDFDFELQPGEVHALVGSNGAGKSTFARILSGLTRRDGGQMWLEGKEYAPQSKRQAEELGVVMVLQELNVIGTLTIAENLFLNRLPHRSGWIRSATLHERARAALARVGLDDLDPALRAGNLGVAHQQLIEIAGALSRNCKVLILDEPTAALTGPEIARLFENIRQLQAQKVGIIYVSHRMEELKQIANRITVMRDGRRVATHDLGAGTASSPHPNASAITPAELVREMVGHELPTRPQSHSKNIGAPALTVRNLQAAPGVQDVSLEVRVGEILGIAGLIGSGRTETLRAIFGADRKTGGEILVRGKPVEIRSPKDAVRAGIALVPEDRKQHGLLLPLSVRVNTTLATLSRHAGRTGWLRDAAEQDTAKALAEKLKLRCASLFQAVSELSGGNQQKVVVARWLARDCDILLFDEPTRGIDAAAKDLIWGVLRELASAGKALLVVSSELPELLALSDRILVMCEGRITAEFTPEEWTPEKITRTAFAHQSKSSNHAPAP